jgi:hypothetical protein
MTKPLGEHYTLITRTEGEYPVETPVGEEDSVPAGGGGGPVPVAAVPVAAGGGDAGVTTTVLTTAGMVTVAPVAVTPGIVTTDVTCAFAAYAANVIINAIFLTSCIFQLSNDSED